MMRLYLETFSGDKDSKIRHQYDTLWSRCLIRYVRIFINLPRPDHVRFDSELRFLRSTVITRFFATMNLSDSRSHRFIPSLGSRWVVASHEGGSLVFLRISSVLMSPSLLRRTPSGLVSLVVSCIPGPGLCPRDASFRPKSTGSASALPFSKLAQCSLALRPDHSLSCSHSTFPAVFD
jgi:hypothetical protein